MQYALCFDTKTNHDVTDQMVFQCGLQEICINQRVVDIFELLSKYHYENIPTQITQVYHFHLKPYISEIWYNNRPMAQQLFLDQSSIDMYRTFW